MKPLQMFLLAADKLIRLPLGWSLRALGSCEHGS